MPCLARATSARHCAQAKICNCPTISLPPPGDGLAVLVAMVGRPGLAVSRLIRRNVPPARIRLLTLSVSRRSYQLQPISLCAVLERIYELLCRLNPCWRQLACLLHPRSSFVCNYIIRPYGSTCCITPATASPCRPRYCKRR